MSCSRNYRWWTFLKWNDYDDYGVKLGPVTIFCSITGWGICILNRWCWDD